MVFKGTQTRSPLEIATALESLGGDLNAFTDREFTCFHAMVLHEHVPQALDVLSDLILRPTFPKDQLERERKVLLQELSMVEESPDDWIGDLFFQTVWKDQPLGRTVIGSRRTIRTITRNQLQSYFHKYYRPENIVVSVAGNIRFDEVAELCEKAFAFPSGRKAPVGAPKASVFRGRKKAVALDSEQVHLLLGFEGIGFRSPLRFDALILSFFLGGGMSSRLFQEIREVAALAYSVDCECVPFTDSGVFTIYVALAPRSVSSCLSILSREILRLKEEPLTNRELDFVKGQLKGTILLSSDQMEVRQESLGRNEIVFGRHVSVDEVIGEIDRVSSESVQRLAREVFVPEREGAVALGGAKLSPKKLSIF
jgi:predicted Zn-dependent peptidase